MKLINTRPSKKPTKCYQADLYHRQGRDLTEIQICEKVAIRTGGSGSMNYVVNTKNCTSINLGGNK
jgi:hypothetical protein